MINSLFCLEQVVIKIFNISEFLSSSEFMFVPGRKQQAYSHYLLLIINKTWIYHKVTFVKYRRDFMLYYFIKASETSILCR